MKSTRMLLAAATSILVAWMIVHSQKPSDVVAQDTSTYDFVPELETDLSTGARFLNIRLTSRLKTPITLGEFAVPENGTILVAVKPNHLIAGEMIDKDELSNPGPIDLTVSPGVEIRRRINLGEKFSGLNEALTHTDVILFWSYQLWPDGGIPLERKGGWLLIPKTR